MRIEFKYGGKSFYAIGNRVFTEDDKPIPRSLFKQMEKALLEDRIIRSTQKDRSANRTKRFKKHT